MCLGFSLLNETSRMTLAVVTLPVKPLFHVQPDLSTVILYPEHAQVALSYKVYQSLL